LGKQVTIFDELVQFKAPKGFSARVATAAQRDHTSSAEFLRRTMIARLKEIGLPLDPVDQRNKGSAKMDGVRENLTSARRPHLVASVTEALSIALESRLIAAGDKSDK
jgi:hypothetical protein